MQKKKINLLRKVDFRCTLMKTHLDNVCKL